MSGFQGFVEQKTIIHIPEELFENLLPVITDPLELKLILYFFWIYSKHTSEIDCIGLEELLISKELRNILVRPGDPRPYQARLISTLAISCSHNAILELETHVEGRAAKWYFINTEKHREYIRQIKNSTPAKAEELLQSLPGIHEWSEGLNIDAFAPDPTIFELYEQNIGLLLPILIDDLEEAAKRYPAEWIREAFHEAVKQNKRNWKYIQAILQRWDNEGKGGK